MSSFRVSFCINILLTIGMTPSNSLNDTDPGRPILQYLKTHEGSLLSEGPINLNEDLICKCSHRGCDYEIVRMLGDSFRGTCRARGGMCFKQVMRENNGKEMTVLGCFSKEASPDMFCSSRQVRPEANVMACCNHQSLCNAYLNVSLLAINGQSQSALPLPIYALLFAAILIAAIFSFIGMAIGFMWFQNKRGKHYLLPWILTAPDAQGQEMEDSSTLPIKVSYEGDELGHLSRLLGNLEDSNTTGSGSGLPWLVQRTIARQIELKSEIGMGRFGEVWLGIWKGEPVAVKIFSSRDERSWYREVEVFQTNMLRHPHVLRFIASDNKDTGTTMQLWLVTEYHPHGSLFDYLSMNAVSSLTMLQMLRSVANGLSFLHTEIPGIHCKPAIAHRDLKSKNILVKSDLTCVIADLGLAVRYSSGELNLPDNSKCGTIRYLAPELLGDSFPVGRFDAYVTADMYAVGLIIWEVARRCIVNGIVGSFEPAYFEYVPREPTVDDMRRCVCIEKNRPTVPSSFLVSLPMSEIARLMHECWAETPSSRLTSMNVRLSIDRLAESLKWDIRKF